VTLWVTRRTFASLFAAGLAAAALLSIGGCTGLAYYSQSISGHLAMVRAARPVAEVLADSSTTADTRRRLEVALKARQFASRELHLPDNASYTRYADLQRQFVVWNVIATPALSLTPQTWCFAVAGCVSYRGYFDKAEAERFAADLRNQGLDVNVAGVPAYSTLGKTEWLGGDPLLNTFIRYPEAEVARLIFHELAHQIVYLAGDTTFNESFAVAVEREGLRRWLALPENAAQRALQESFATRRTGFLRLLREARGELVGIYASTQSDALKLQAKQAALTRLRERYAAQKVAWHGFSGYDGFFAQDLNNAHLAAIATYTEHVAAFERILEDEQRDLPRFFDRVRALAALSPAERGQQLAVNRAVRTP
jgi:predicted aminopeptidase